MRRRGVFLAWATWLFVSYAVVTASTVVAVPPGNEHFERTWARTDKPVADGQAGRTWMWGPQANTGILLEPYVEGPDGEREVQYFDKSRMEITDPGANLSSTWYVTNGLLVVELITGNLQVGHDSFEPRSPAAVNVAGDSDDPTGPTYATFSGLLDEPATPAGTLLITRVSQTGVLTDDPGLSIHNLAAGHVDEVTNHTIAAPFHEFMHSSGLVWQDGALVEASLFEDPLFATGRPVTEAYWANVKVAGVYRDVLMQCFERRCLTHDPGNDPDWRTEAGNVGQHYFTWRNTAGGPAPLADYGDAPDGGPTGYPAPFPQIGNFPTLFASGGAHTLDLTRATLGPTASAEIDANDPNDPDGVPNLVNADSDDGLIGLTTVLTQIPPPAVLEVEVHGGTGGLFYLNVLIDLDMDGEWGGSAAGNEPEWVVRNLLIDVLPGEVRVVATPAFAFANGNRLPSFSWMRVALTSEQVVSDDWDGTGSFSAGEIEDHLITLPTFDGDPDGKPLPALAVDCNGPYIFPAGVDVIPAFCTVTNLSDTPGPFTWSLERLSGGVDVVPLMGDGVIGAAGDPGASVVLPFQATRGALPSDWRITVIAVDPPSIVHPGGVVLGFPDTEVEFSFTDVLVPEKTVDQQQITPGGWLAYSIAMPANPELVEASEGTIVDPVNAAFIDGEDGPLIAELTCTIGDCYYDDSTNNIIWTGELLPGDVVHMSFSMYVPLVLFVDELPNCIQGFDGLTEFSGVCVVTDVVQ
jgi:hypothetical protein